MQQSSTSHTGATYFSRGAARDLQTARVSRLQHTHTHTHQFNHYRIKSTLQKLGHTCTDLEIYTKERETNKQRTTHTHSQLYKLDETMTHQNHRANNQTTPRVSFSLVLRHDYRESYPAASIQVN